MHKLSRFFLSLIAFGSLFLLLGAAPHPVVLPPFHQAAADGNVDEVKRLLSMDPSLLNARDEDGNIALHHAASSGWVPVVESLLAAGCDPNTPKAPTGNEYDGWTPLHHAAAGNHVDVIKVLLKAGADKMARSASDETPLHVACWRNQLDAVKALVEAGTSVNIRRKQNVTPLEMSSFFGREEMVRYLLSRGADVNGRVYEGNTPLHQAARNGHINTMLALVEGGADLEARRQDGKTPLHYAVINGQIGAAQLLIGMGADPDSKDTDGLTPLAEAQKAGQGGAAAFLTSYLAARTEMASLVAQRKAAMKGLLTHPAETTVYKNDFTAETVGAEWATTPLGPNVGELKLSELPGTTRRFLGEFGTQNLQLSLSRLPTHSQVTVTLDLYILRTWDGEGIPGSGPDIWEASVTGGPLLLRTTFANTERGKETSLVKTPMQSFPGDWTIDHHPGRTGALANDVLGFSIDDKPRNAVYRLTFTFPHNAPYLVLNFAGKGLEDLANESWGIGKIEVKAGKADAPARGTRATKPKKK